MDPFGKMTLQHLTIEAYDDPERTFSAGQFQAPFNPDSLSQAFSLQYESTKALGALGGHQRYQHTPSSTLHCTLILDNSPTLAANPIAPAFERTSVTEQVQQLLDLAYHVVGENHEPRYLTLRWGAFSGGNILAETTVFMCRLSTVEINYTHFKKTGEPTRAEIDLAFLGDEPHERRSRAANLSSPDLTHAHVVQAGETLPLLCQRIYGDPSYHVQVARHNGMDTLRDLEPNQVLYFPPIVTGKEQR